jgi:deoxyhypusine synthase
MPESLFSDAADIIPQPVQPGASVPELLASMGKTCFEARNLHRGAELLRRMVDDGDTIWLGIAGAGIAGGMGGTVISLIEGGFVDVICSTGAQVYHDLHFAFGLPVKAVCPHGDDDRLRRHGDTRIYDIGIREQETLVAQDKLIRQFVREYHDALRGDALSSWEFNQALGTWVEQNAPHPERSFVVSAADAGVPIFWDSLANHSIAMNLVMTDREGFPVRLSAQQDIFDSAALAYASNGTGFISLGGGGPKNFIQQTGPMIHQILGASYGGAQRGLQIGTATAREGSLSGCTFEEAVTWGKYERADETRLVQIWGEYSVLFPLLAQFVVDSCEARPLRNLTAHVQEYRSCLEQAS